VLANPFSAVTLRDSHTCEILPSATCCWHGRQGNTTYDVAVNDDANVRLRRLLEAYGPWTTNDKLMLSYLFGTQGKPGSVLLPPADVAASNATNDDSLAFVIMIHSEFEVRLPTLLSSLYSKHHTYIIHVDLSTKEDSYVWLRQFLDEFCSKHGATNVFLLSERFYGSWGSVTLVYQELAAMAELVKMERSGQARRFSHVINLSAFDFPIKPLPQLEAFLRASQDISFMEVLPPEVRREARQAELYLPCNRTLLITNFSTNQVCGSGSANWMFKHNPKWVYGEGSQWHFLSRSFVEYLVTSLDPIELLFSMKFTLIPDEAFFQSAMLSSPFTSKLKDYNYRYLPWSDGLQILPKHVQLFKETDAFFARKLLDVDLTSVLIRELLLLN